MRKADNLPPYCAVVMKSGSLNFLEPSGPAQACYGRTLPFVCVCVYIYIYIYITSHSSPSLFCSSSYPSPFLLPFLASTLELPFDSTIPSCTVHLPVTTQLYCIGANCIALPVFHTYSLTQSSRLERWAE